MRLLKNMRLISLCAYQPDFTVTTAPLNQHSVNVSVLGNKQAIVVCENAQEKPVSAMRQQQQTAVVHTGSDTCMLPSIKRKPSSSPANSPHKLGKQGPKRRTVAVKNLSNVLSTSKQTSYNEHAY